MRARINIKKQFNEMDEFLKLKNHLGVILSNFSNLTTADSNDLYDILYIKKKLQIWSDKNIENRDIVEDIDNLLEAINIITNSLTETQVSQILNNNIKKPEQLNKAKYNKRNKFKKLRDKKKKKFVPNTTETMFQYIKSNIIKALTYLTILILLRVAPKLAEHITSTTTSILETNPTDETINAIATINGQITTDLFSPVINTISVIISIITVALIVFKMIDTIMSMLFINSSKSMRELLSNHFSKIINPEVKELCEQIPDTSCYEEVNTINRLTLSETLLNNLEVDLKHNLWDIQHDDIDELREKVNKIQTKLKSAQGLDKVNTLVEVEILNEKYLELKDKYDISEYF